MSIFVLHQSRPKARVEHTCEMCERTINPGEPYLRQRCVADDPYVWKECQHCEALLALYPVISQWADEECGTGPDDIRYWEPDTDVAREHKRQWSIRWSESDVLVDLPEAAL